MAHQTAPLHIGEVALTVLAVLCYKTRSRTAS
jgi:hypothetical protein